jgi:shikimate dehydrogenase
LKTYALIGHPLSHSFSVDYFYEKFKKQSINAEYVNWDTEGINGLKTEIFDRGYAGVNVTIPYKKNILSYLDELTPEAKQIGAVNCIQIQGKRLIGHNTDVIGFAQSLSNSINTRPSYALIFGNGGSSNAVQFVLSKMEIPFRVVSRSAHLTYDNLSCSDIENSELLINCTPLGMYPNVDSYPDISYDSISEKHIGFDLVYNPSETAFLARIKGRGGRIVNGLEMLRLQAEASWTIWNS